MIALLTAVARASGSRWACTVPCRAGMWLAHRLDSIGDTLADPVRLLRGDAEPIAERTASEQAAAIGRAFSRPSARRRPVRLVLSPAGSPHLALLLERGPAEPVALAALAQALQGLAEAAAAVAPSPDAAAVERLVERDGRPALLANATGEPIAISPSMRRLLAGATSAGNFLPTGGALLLLDRIRELAAEVSRSGAAAASDAPGMPDGSRLRVQPLGGGHLAVLVEGSAALEASLRTLASGELTGREVTCGLLLARGLAYRDIAAALGLSPDTVKLHLRALYRKLRVTGREGLVARLAGLQGPGKTRQDGRPLSA